MPRRFGSADRPYSGSHPWISFAIDMDRLAAMDFVRLGEALSKCDHIAGVPLPPDIAKTLHMIYLVKGIHATTQIEGNSLSEDEVRARVEGDLPLPESQEYLGKEIDNILAACNLVAEELAAGRNMRLTRERIELFNEMVLDGLPRKEDVIPGKIRTKGVGVGNVYLGAPAGDCEFLLEELCGWLEQLVEDAGPDWHRPIGLLRAILAHLYLAWIHPFGDGNGRTARLVEVRLLRNAGFRRGATRPAQGDPEPSARHSVGELRSHHAPRPKCPDYAAAPGPRPCPAWRPGAAHPDLSNHPSDA